MTGLAISSEVEDTPRSAYRALEARATLTVVGVLVGLAALAWWATVDNADEMSGMVQGFAHVGTAMPFDMTTAVFLAMWTTMTVAMMFPTVAPIVLLHRMVVRRGGGGPGPTVAFGAGYLVVWTAVGLVPLALLLGFRELQDGSNWILRAGGVVILLAGLYQFTPWKEACLRACRSPLNFLMTHQFGEGVLGAVRVGISHGLYCLGCCWAVMAVLVVVGMMNLAWMALAALIFLAEKNWRHGPRLSTLVGTATALLGVAILLHPPLLERVTPRPDAPMMMEADAPSMHG